MKKIYVSGLGTYSPVGYGIEETWNTLLAGKSGINYRTEWKNQEVRSHFHGSPPLISFKDEIKWNEYFMPTDYSIFGLYACKKAIEDAKLNLNIIGNEVGMIIETSMGSAFSVEEYLSDLYKNGISKISPMKFTKTVTNTAIGDISRFFKLNGPSSLLLNECSICYGLDLLHKGIADIIICGAIDHYTDFYIQSEQETEGLVDESFSLDEAITRTTNINHKILGEGACFIVLETEESLQKRNIKPYAQIIDYSTTFDFDNVMTSCKRSLSTLQNNINNIKDYLTEDLKICWTSAYTTNIQRNENEPKNIINSLSMKQINFINHKYFTGDMKSASNLFGLLVASKSLKEQVILDKYSENEDIDIALVNTVQEGGGSSLFLLKNINQTN